MRISTFAGLVDQLTVRWQVLAVPREHGEAVGKARSDDGVHEPCHSASVTSVPSRFRLPKNSSSRMCVWAAICEVSVGDADDLTAGVQAVVPLNSKIDR